MTSGNEILDECFFYREPTIVFVDFDLDLPYLTTENVFHKGERERERE